MSETFSQRYGFDNEPPITVRNTAPDELRNFLATLFQDNIKLYSGTVLDTIREVCKEPFSRAAYSKYTEIYDEIAALLMRCEWFHVYDSIEKVYDKVVEADKLRWDSPARFPDLLEQLTSTGGLPRTVYERSQLDADGLAKELNRYFHANGIDKQLLGGEIQHRGDEHFEDTLASAVSLTGEATLSMAQNELREARRALSRRPVPDLTGAISHAMNAWLSVARAIIGDDNANPSEILRRKRDLAPKPMDQVIKGAWGYSSQYGRKVSETKIATYNQAELVVHLSAMAITYIVRESGLIDKDTP